MADAPIQPLRVGRPSEDVFGRWWRTALQIPLHPRAMELHANVAYGPLERQRLDVWKMPTTAERAPVIYYIHGGAWTFGDKRQQGRPMLHEFVSRGWVVVAINYRLAPQFPWPAQIEDATRALGWIKTNIASLAAIPIASWWREARPGGIWRLFSPFRVRTRRGARSTSWGV